MILHNLPIASLNKHTQQINNLTKPQIHLRIPINQINRFTNIPQLLIITNNKFPIIPINLFDNIDSNVIMWGLGL